MSQKALIDKFIFGRKLLFILVIVGSIVFGLINAEQLRSQSQAATNAPLPTFEVASIKQDRSGGGEIRLGGPGVSRFVAKNVSAKFLIQYAYGIKNSQLTGRPNWIDSERYDIEAKVEDSLAQQLRRLPLGEQAAQIRLMIQSLLADRFQLRVSHETKELPVYALVVRKGGPKISPLATVPPSLVITDRQALVAAPSGPANSKVPMLLAGGTMFLRNGDQITLTLNGAPLSNLVERLWQQIDRPVLDQTGLDGIYQFTLKWTVDPTLRNAPLLGFQGGADASTSDTSGTSIFTAIQEQLGLKLESTKGLVDTIVIDHVEEPSEN